MVLGRGSGFGVGEVGLPGGNGELGAAEEERRRAKLGDAVVWRGADAGRVSVNADCSTAKQAHCTRFANRDSFFVGNAFVVGSVLVHPTTDVAEGAFLTQSRVAHSFRSRGWRRCVCRSRGLNTGPRDLSPLEKLCEQKKTTHATTRHALNISFLLFAFVILHVFLLLRSSSCPSTSQTSFLPVLLPAALLFLIIFSPPTSKAVVIVCDARSHRFSSCGRGFFRRGG